MLRQARNHDRAERLSSALTPAPEDLLRRSFRLSGHKTSLSLERVFWDLLKAEAAAQKRTMTDLIAELDVTRSCGLSRAVRIYLVERLLTRKG